jgi:hypothetical protein
MLLTLKSLELGRDNVILKEMTFPFHENKPEIIDRVMTVLMDK